MHRRHFLQQTSTTLLLGASLPIPFWKQKQLNPIKDEDLLAYLIEANDKGLPRLLELQRDDEDSNNGGIPDRYGIHHAMTTANVIQRWASAFVATSSDFYHSPAVVEAMEQASLFLLQKQHDDGTIDLLSTNFHSTPDTAFVVEPLCLAYLLLEKDQYTKTENCRKSLGVFLQKAGEALTVGGIHTPNHRWVVSMALARLHALFPNQKYVNRATEWLAEKIDIDPDGQYHEKSTNIYSPLTNRCLITIARLLDRPDLYEPVRRNLAMTLYYIHPNGEVATEASGRQDKYQTGTLTNYYYPYRFMALHDKDGQFAQVSQFIPQQMDWSKLVMNLAYLQEDATLLESLPPSSSLPDNYVRSFPYSKLVRIRRGDTDATILADNPTFFTFQKGEAVLQGVRLATAFFGKGQFVGKEIEQDDKTFRLRQELEAPYYQPYPKEDLPNDGDWGKMPRENRPQSEVQKLVTQVAIEEKEPGRFELRFEISGTDNVPVALELGFRKGGTLEGIQTVIESDEVFLFDKKEGGYTYQNNQVQFGPGQATHAWTQLRGALPKLDADCVYITGFTPFKFSLQIS